MAISAISIRPLLGWIGDTKGRRLLIALGAASTIRGPARALLRRQRADPHRRAPLRRRRQRSLPDRDHDDGARPRRAHASRPGCQLRSAGRAPRDGNGPLHRRDGARSQRVRRGVDRRAYRHRAVPRRDLVPTRTSRAGDGWAGGSVLVPADASRGARPRARDGVGAARRNRLQYLPAPIREGSRPRRRRPCPFGRVGHDGRDPRRGRPAP